MKTPTVAKLKKKLDTIYSQYVRLSNSNFEIVSCVTCGIEKPWKEMQCGHYVSRTHNATRFDEQNTHPQCLTAESKLRLFNGTSKSIADIKAGDELWAFNEQEHTLREKAVVEAVDSFVPDALYEVELDNGDKFYATADHRVVANGKWAYIKDMLHDVSAYDILEL